MHGDDPHWKLNGSIVLVATFQEINRAWERFYAMLVQGSLFKKYHLKNFLLKERANVSTYFANYFLQMLAVIFMKKALP